MPEWAKDLMVAAKSERQRGSASSFVESEAPVSDVLPFSGARLWTAFGVVFLALICAGFFAVGDRVVVSKRHFWGEAEQAAAGGQDGAALRCGAGAAGAESESGAADGGGKRSRAF